ncbi:hypothetical protein SAMN05660826_01415 [Caldanaerovirga acetigignens]|uniref:Uncharacterized protein n=1 Tax=Caldanaerovirga acetigignens TaxID=447595 RepID=A0A1M7K053_9FIRM|nr:hypothetical protein [Caldanaerovirga acetigignens]SHM58585.1 hypothetical protein SAMN05660826_01415 [Caldanaerovirga acetigignens]
MAKVRSVFIAGLILIFLVGYGIGMANVGEPGSQDDPLVTKSYVDKVVSELKSYLDESSSGNQSIGTFEVVYLEKGDRLVAGKGAEIILRSGIAKVVDSENGGIADVTDGKDLRRNERAPQNHLLIVPRDDGRGLIAETNVVLTVRGSFKVTK